MSSLLHLHTITLKARTHEYGDVYTFVFEKPEELTYSSGNYVHIHLPTVEPPYRSVREMSFASAPQDPEITFSITTESKSHWQMKLLALKPGDTLELFKIKGHLITPSAGVVVMIAQGLGVTPFRSIIREHFEANQAITPILIHVGRDTYLFEDEFSALPFEQHRIVREELDTTLDTVIINSKNALYMIAGSPVFIEMTQKILKEKDIPESTIQTDTFKGLPDS
jgi:ferredoxin-NADP reductase